MNQQHPNITIPIDLTNPGQFFACCGLLELADRLWPGTEGWFETAERFLIRNEMLESISFTQLCSKVMLCNLSFLLSPDDRGALAALTSIAKAIHDSLSPTDGDQLFDHEALVLQDGEAVAPLSFDSGRVGTAQDVGYSPDKVGQPISCCVWTEFLTLIALQRFSLQPDSYDFFTYHAWHEPLSPSVAATISTSNPY